jgi:uncharacterized protein related to proFAR isomerase
MYLLAERLDSTITLIVDVDAVKLETIDKQLSIDNWPVIKTQNNYMLVAHVRLK